MARGLVASRVRQQARVGPARSRKLAQEMKSGGYVTRALISPGLAPLQTAAGSLFGRNQPTTLCYADVEGEHWLCKAVHYGQGHWDGLILIYPPPVIPLSMSVLLEG